MKKIFENIRNNYSEIYKGFLFLLTMIIIVLLFPESTQFRFEYQEGRPWMYEDLSAPVDFAIKKTEKELEAERKDIKENNKLYFAYDIEKTQQTTNIVSAQFDSLWLKTYGFGNRLAFANNKQVCLQLIDEILQTGLVQVSSEIAGEKNDRIVYVVRNNIAKELFLNFFYTSRTAYLYIVQELKSKNDVEREFISEFLAPYLIPNVYFDAERTQNELESRLADISPNKGVVLKGQTIIGKGEIIDSDVFKILNSLKADFQSRSRKSNFSFYLGKIILVSIPLFTFGLFLFFYYNDVFSDTKNLIMMLILIISMVAVTRLIVVYDSSLSLLIPLMISPIIVRAFYDTRIALIVHITTVILVSFVVPDSFTFIFIQLMTGLIAIISVVKLHKRSQFFLSALYVFVSYSIIYIGIELIRGASIADVDFYVFFYFAISAGLTLLASPIIYLFEKIFGMVTDVSLLEYADTNNPLIRQLSTQAPGTFHHSIQVGNIAEEAAMEIGANPLLVRAGAMYHDIGKMDNPMFFTENQSGNYSPHNELSYQESANIIISHVLQGIKIAKKHNLPNQIIDFIRTHHGTKRVEYFYRMHLKDLPDEEVKLNEFTYHGPIPYSQETCILMMADAVEAASRSIKNPDAKSISELVDKIIQGQLDQGQYNNANISLRQINTVKKVFKRKLLNIYHIRIEYPD